MYYTTVQVVHSWKEKYRGLKSSSKLPNPEHDDVLKKNDLTPGDMVSTDQHKCTIKGRFPNSRGEEDSKMMYFGKIHSSIMHQVILQYITNYHWDPKTHCAAKSYLSYIQVKLVDHILRCWGIWAK